MTYQVTRKNRDGSKFILGTYATIQEANRQRLLANARRTDANYKVEKVS